MGQRIAHETLSLSDKTELTAGFARENSAVIGHDLGDILKIGPIGIPASPLPAPDTGSAQDIADILIDFSHPSALPAHLEWCQKTKTALVLGTTGLSDSDMDTLKTAAQDIPVLYGANMSLGVNILAGLVEKLSRVLDADFDIEIVEAHHKHKKDAPSGTALMLGNAAAKGRGVNLKTAAVMSREGETGERQRGSIGFATIRGGDIAGEHSVLYLGEGERLELSHKSSDARIFARGAVKAAHWLAQQPSGFYTMTDMLGINS